jgi:hypothetical protein
MSKKNAAIINCAALSALLMIFTSSLLVFPALAGAVIGTISNDKHNINHGTDKAIPVATGNLGLDRELNSFYSCVKKAVRDSKPTDSTTHNYFDDEPTKQEVIHCFKEIFSSER